MPATEVSNPVMAVVFFNTAVELCAPISLKIQGSFAAAPRSLTILEAKDFTNGNSKRRIVRFAVAGSPYSRDGVIGFAGQALSSAWELAGAEFWQDADGLVDVHRQ